MSGHFDVDAVRKEFPAVERITYLDSGFQTPLARPVKAAIDQFLREGLETAGPKSVWLDRVEQTREKLGRFLGVSADEIAFTKNTSESMAGSRFPGSRVIAFDRLPRGPNGAPVVRLVVGYPPTVAGAAAELSVETDAPHSLE